MKRFLGLMAILFLSGTACGQGFSVNSFGQTVDWDGAIVVSQPVVTYSVPQSVVTRRTVLHVGPYTRPYVRSYAPVRTYARPLYVSPYRTYAPVRRAVSGALNCVGGTCFQ